MIDSWKHEEITRSKHILAAGIIAVFLLLVGCESLQTRDLTIVTSVVLSTVTPHSASIIPSMQPPTQIRPAETNTPFPSAIPPTEAPELQPIPQKMPLEAALKQLEGLPIDQFFEDSYRLIQLRDPDQLFINGLAEEYGVANDAFSNISDAYLRETQMLETAILTMLRTYNRDALSVEQRLSYDVYEWVLDDLVQGHEFMVYDYPINPLTIWGKQNWLIDFMVNYQPIQNIQDAEDYISRLSKIDIWANQLLEGLKLREQEGMIPPRYVLQGAIDQIEGHLRQTGPDSFHIDGVELLTTFQEKLDKGEGINPQEKEQLFEAARNEIEHTFIPAYQALEEYLENLRAKAGNVSGLNQYPNGQASYAYFLRHQTGSDLTPNQAHALGLSEVKRLQEQVLQAADDAGYPQDITLGQLQEQLSSESEVLVGDSLLAEYKRLIGDAEKVSSLFFNDYPTGGLTILPEPFGSGIGYYLPPPLDGTGPGRFFTNPEIPMPTYLIPSYIFHETVPGHHLQGVVARELNLPMFRRVLELNGYMEGWALYAEGLAWEMGLYENDPQGNLGRLLFELSRAARLVIDTGIHNIGWSRQEAAKYYEEATGNPTSLDAMDRYVILPGQGCGYTIGMLEIFTLRQQAKNQLGEDFDIKAFHHEILSNGNLPLEILREVVNEWIMINTH